MTCGLERTAIPASVHCDHLIQAFQGADADLARAQENNAEVFEFLRSACEKYGIEFWAPGSGIIHQIVLENYAAPGMLMLGTDSHTPNASGLGGLAIGVGGADAVDAMTNTPWELMAPKVLNVHLTGELDPWCSPKDVILTLAGLLTVRGGTGKILEYSGPGLAKMPATGLATMSNMGAEVGATTSAFPYSAKMGEYLRATGRDYVASQAEAAAAQGYLAADKDAQYDDEVHIDLSKLEPTLNGPFTPDLSTPLSEFVARAKSEDRPHPVELTAAQIGSCTNSSYADLARCASLARQATAAGIKAKVPFDVTPGSERVRATIERDGIEGDLTSAGARVLANACGPCIGQWKRTDHQGEQNVILTSFNRNFKGRNDGNVQTWNMLTSPELVTAMAFAGRLDFNPVTDAITTPEGKEFRFAPPQGDVLPNKGYDLGDESLTPASSPEPQPEVQVAISPESTRLEVLQPFSSPFEAGNYELPPMRTLLRIRGKCTTDHISAAGPWLKYKGHLSNLAENTLIGASNDETGNVNSAVDYQNGEEASIPEIAKRYRGRNQAWVLVADHNYGEGSAREHAALQPRFFGCNLVVARSIARIAETNLRKQGVLTLLFENEDDYLKIGQGDLVETVNLKDLIDPVQGSLSTQVKLRVTKYTPTGDVKETFEVPTKHSLSATHLAWIRAGSALNLIREQAEAKKHTASSPVPSSAPPRGARTMCTFARAMGTRGMHTTSAALAFRRQRETSTRALNPSDPRYVAPETDSRTQSIVDLTFPLGKKEVNDLAQDPYAKRMAEAENKLPFGPEVHTTIVRAWLAHQRDQRSALETDLRRKFGAMRAACEDLKDTHPLLHSAAVAKQRTRPNNRSPEEVERLKRYGLTPGAQLIPENNWSEETRANAHRLRPIWSSPSARIKVVQQGGRRLSGLFPREWRPPTKTPRREGWPSFSEPDQF